jgi:hypothetical protein
MIKNKVIYFVFASIFILPTSSFACSLSYGGNTVNINCSSAKETSRELYKAYRYIEKNKSPQRSTNCRDAYRKARNVDSDKFTYRESDTALINTIMQQVVGMCDHELGLLGR